MLTALKVKRAKPGRHADGGGLYLAVSKTEAKSWLFIWKRGSRAAAKRHARGLGSADTVSLAEARELAADARKIVARGGDLPKRMASAGAGAMTFGDCADSLIEAKEAGWRNAKHRYQWRQTLGVHAAKLRPLPVDQITTDQVLAVLQPLRKAKTETATRLRQPIEAVLDYAKAHRYRDGENPARWRGHLSMILPAPDKLARVSHLAALPYAELPVFIKKLRAMDGVAPRALEFVILTAARSGEVRGAKWPEIDLDQKVWTVPGERMKAGEEHRVPLSDRAIRLLLQQRKQRINDFVFPGFREGRPLSDMALMAVLRRLGSDVTTHGFRSSFRDWAGDCTSHARETVESALAHVIANKVEAAYRRSDALEKRRELMQAWADYCEPKAGNVVALRGAKRKRARR
jgi:integrase